ncbi:hypothetical protein AYI78_08605 [Shewanella algae]|nr:hypothetical protein AYI76_12355 [Shewanella algae]TVO86070.1 hypothetical protein AYI78_08605 [Shewanella algae]TVO98048.1 hypothetical protein AYI79_05065 [Shewanella algae]
MRVLLIEDNPDTAALIAEQLPQLDWDFARNGNQGLQLALSHHYQLILLDLNLPGLDGVSLCQQLRNQGIDCPVIMLTARDTREDIHTGLITGADDYLVKPFDTQELWLRMQAVVRRTSGEGFASRLSYKEISLDLKRREVWREGAQISLSPASFTLLTCLMRRPNQVISKEELESALWQDGLPDEDILRKHIYLLRQKLDKPFATPRIQTIAKIGYKLQ